MFANAARKLTGTCCASLLAAGMLAALLHSAGTARAQTADLTVDSSTGKAALKLSVTNTGWAKIANERPLFFVLRDGNRTVMSRRIAFDLTAVPAGGSLTKQVNLGNWADLTSARYTAYLSAPDSSSRLSDNAEYALFFANDGATMQNKGLNLLGSFTLSQ